MHYEDSEGSGSLLRWVVLALVLVAMDQISKVWIQGHFALGDSQMITSYFNLVRAHNPGAAFSFLAQASGWQRWFFVGLGVFATCAILWLLFRHGHQRLFACALSMILGGAVGNVIDRVIHGHVIDFLQFHWGWLAPLFPGGYFPAFNVADCAISVGVALLILDELLRVRRA